MAIAKFKKEAFAADAFLLSEDEFAELRKAIEEAPNKDAFDKDFKKLMSSKVMRIPSLSSLFVALAFTRVCVLEKNSFACALMDSPTQNIFCEQFLGKAAIAFVENLQTQHRMGCVVKKLRLRLDRFKLWSTR